MDTTRHYPRTLNEAFPNGPDYACAIERFDRRHRTPWRLLVLIGVGVLLLLAAA